MTPSRNVVAVTDEAVERRELASRIAATSYEFMPNYPLVEQTLEEVHGAIQTAAYKVLTEAAYPSMVAEVERLRIMYATESDINDIRGAEIERLTKTLTDMRDRDDRNGSLPIWYREQIDASLTEAKT